MKILMLILFAAASAVAVAASSGNDRTEIELRTQELNRAFETKDFTAWRQILADDFKAITPRETYTKSEFIAGGVEEARGALRPITVDIRLVQLTVNGRTASGASRERTCYGVRGRDRRVHRLCYRQRFTETWRKDGDAWKLLTVRDLPGQKFELDGSRVTRAQLQAVRRR